MPASSVEECSASLKSPQRLPLSRPEISGKNQERQLNTQRTGLRQSPIRPFGTARQTARGTLRWGRRKASGQFLVLASILAGLLAGTAAILLKTVVHALHLLVTERTLPHLGPAVLIAAPVLGILLTALATRFLFSREKGKGIPGVLAAMPGKGARMEKTKTFSYLLRSTLTVGLGGSLGLETPIVVTGSAIGANLGDVFRLSPKKRTVLLASGAAAGIAAVFNAPVAGVMFAAEVLLAEMALSDLIPVIIAAVCGALCSKIALREDILFFFRLRQHFNYGNVPYYVVLGLLAGPISLLFSRTVARAQMLSQRISHFLPKALVGGLLLGGLCILFPALFGEGYGSIKTLADGDPWGILSGSPLQLSHGPGTLLALLAAMLLLKTLASSLTHAAGGIGGNFAPSLFLGAFLGAAFSRAVDLIPGMHLPESNFTIVGMAGVLSGVMRAPLTAIFLIAEITGGYELMIPLMIVSSIAFLLVRHSDIPQPKVS